MSDVQVHPQIKYLSSQIHLPQDLITTEILTKLPLKTVIRSKCVSKQWKSIISSPKFAKLLLKFQQSSPNPVQSLLINRYTFFLTFDYTNYDNGQIVPTEYSFDDSPRSKEGLVELELGNDLSGQIEKCKGRISIVGSCNGLICLSFKLGFLYLWNPTTRETRKIANPRPFRKKARKETIWGFGYVSSMDDYKIVTLSQRLRGSLKKAYTLTLKGGKWEKVNANANASVLDGYKVDSMFSSGVLVGERVFWRMVNGLNFLCIVGFDLVEESFQEVGIPDWLWRNFLVCEIGGCLCTSWLSGYNVKVAMLKQYGDSGSWVKLYSIGCKGLECSNLFGYTVAGKIIMDTIEGSTLLIDTSQEEYPTYVEILTMSSYSKDVVRHVESLVSPFGLVDDTNW